MPGGMKEKKTYERQGPEYPPIRSLKKGALATFG
jgi:hypothetical protein